jgi:hypothetical protein
LEDCEGLEQAAVALEAPMVREQVEVQDSPARSVEGEGTAVVSVPTETETTVMGLITIKWHKYNAK